MHSPGNSPTHVGDVCSTAPPATTNKQQPAMNENRGRAHVRAGPKLALLHQCSYHQPTTNQTDSQGGAGLTSGLAPNLRVMALRHCSTSGPLPVRSKMSTAARYILLRAAGSRGRMRAGRQVGQACYDRRRHLGRQQAACRARHGPPRGRPGPAAPTHRASVCASARLSRLSVASSVPYKFSMFRYATHTLNFSPSSLQHFHNAAAQQGGGWGRGAGAGVGAGGQRRRTARSSRHRARLPRSLAAAAANAGADSSCSRCEGMGSRAGASGGAAPPSPAAASGSSRGAPVVYAGQRSVGERARLVHLSQADQERKVLDPHVRRVGGRQHQLLVFRHGAGRGVALWRVHVGTGGSSRVGWCAFPVLAGR